MNWPNLRISRTTQSIWNTHSLIFLLLKLPSWECSTLTPALTRLSSIPQCGCLQEVQQDWFLPKSHPSEGGRRRRHGCPQDQTRLPQPRRSTQVQRGGWRRRCRCHMAHAPRGAEAGTPGFMNTTTHYSLDQAQCWGWTSFYRQWGLFHWNWFLIRLISVRVLMILK